MTYFSYNEKKCPHCDTLYTDPEFDRTMDKIREEHGQPMIVNSWYRCRTHDEQIGGSGNHPTGRAADIRVTTSDERYNLIRLALKHGITRIGVGRNFLHFDTNNNHPTCRIWVYS